jgi:hypothetical protein
MRLLSLIAIIAFLTGCVQRGVTKEQWQNANFGEKLNDSVYIAYIRQDVTKALIDPDSLKMSCADSRKGWAKKAGFEPKQFGWLVYCEINAKNRFGGYVGAKSYVYLFNGEKVLVRIPQGYGTYDYDYGFEP